MTRLIFLFIASMVVFSCADPMGAQMKYNVEYNGNGHVFGSPPTDLNTYLPGESAAIRGKGMLSKPDFTFAGWNTQPDGLGTNYAEGAVYIMGSRSVTFFARWTQEPTFQVFYDGNQNSQGSAPASSSQYKQGDVVTVLAPGSLAKSGAHFDSWNTQADGGGQEYQGGDSLTMPAANLTLYAKWVDNPVFLYDGNGATSGTPPIDEGASLSGQRTILLGNIGNLAKPGMQFAGWMTKTDGTGSSYTTIEYVVVPEQDVTLYAIWVSDTLKVRSSDSKVAVYGFSSVPSAFLEIPAGVEVLAWPAFRDQDTLTHVSLPASLNTIELNPFVGCDLLEAITVDAKNPYFQSIDGALYDKAATSLISVPKATLGTTFDFPSTLKKVSEYAFYGCTQLKSISLPSGLTSLGEYAFSNCTWLNSVSLGNSLQKLEAGIFNACLSLDDLSIPASVTEISDEALVNAFAMVNFYVSESNSAYKSVDGVIFSKNGTVLVAFPAGRSGTYVVPSPVTQVAAYAFWGVSELQSVTLPSQLTTIGMGAFLKCPHLAEVEIPASVTSIGSFAFEGGSMTSITLLGSNPPSFFGDGTQSADDLTIFSNAGDYLIYVPSGALSIYQNDAYWDRYSAKLTESGS